MEKNIKDTISKILLYVIFILLISGYILRIVDATIYFTNSFKQIGFFDTSVTNFAYSIVTIFFSVIGIFVSASSLLKIHKDHSFNFGVSYLMIIYILFLFNNIFTSIMTFSFDESGPIIIVPNIVTMILSIVGFLILGNSGSRKSNHIFTHKKVFFTIGLCISLAVAILSMTTLSPNNDNTLKIIFFILFFLSIGLSGLFTFISKPTEITEHVEINQTTQIDSDAFIKSGFDNDTIENINRFQNSSNKDVTKKLTKLKQLYDSGLITKEEYEQQKSKYLEEL